MRKRLFTILAFTIILFAVCNLGGDYVLRKGLRQYYCLYPADVLIIGHSMSEMGLERNTLEEKLGTSVAKYCINGAGAGDRLVMLKHYIESTRHKPKLVIYDVSGWSFSDGLAYNSYQLFAPFMTESESVREYIKRYASRKEYIMKSICPLIRYDDTRLGAAIRGFRKDWHNRNFKRFNEQDFRKQLSSGHFWKISFNAATLNEFEKTLSFLDAEGISCLLLALPCVDLLNQAEPERYQQAMELIQNNASHFTHCQFHDMNEVFSSSYSLFADPIHLNPTGQKTVTDALVSFLQQPENAVLYSSSCNISAH